MDRVYSTFDIRAADEAEGAGVITGIASTPTTDRMDDIVVPEGAEFKLPLPLLWQHWHSDPIGHVTEAKVGKAGIEITAQVALGVTEDIDRYWKLIKAGLVRGLSIGFRGLETARIEGSWGIKFLRWEWLELSAVTIPANAEATISSVKHFAARDDVQAAAIQPVPPIAAPGMKSGVVRLDAPARVRAKRFVIRKIHT